ncbi:MAG: putative toxin-antitoxin system toxin component, PIN family, partial [Gammaproteobacteria bacterium]
LSAALAPNGVPARFLDHLLQAGRLVFSSATFAELEARIWLPKFDRCLPIERRRRLLHDANASAFWVDIPDGLASRRHSRDPKDDMFIHAALAAASARLVSGDEDLLCQHPLEGLHILSPRAALEELTRVGGA